MPAAAGMPTTVLGVGSTTGGQSMLGPAVISTVPSATIARYVGFGTRLECLMPPMVQWHHRAGGAAPGMGVVSGASRQGGRRPSVGRSPTPFTRTRSAGRVPPAALSGHDRHRCGGRLIDDDVDHGGPA